jgi:hypothetical protein
VAALAAAACVLAALVSAPAGAGTYDPEKGTVFAGVSDTGDPADYNRFTNAVGKHLPIVQSFHSWGYDSVGAMIDGWGALETRGVFHIHTEDGDGNEVITPRGVSRGNGDGFLMKTTFALGERHSTTYIRPFGEMNNWRNAYCAFDRNGNPKGAAYHPSAFKLAWRRIAIVLRGGPIDTINAKLKDLGMPKLQKDFGTVGLPYTRAALLWTPMTAGSPNTHANRPGTYWPGSKYVDWVGTDIYSRFPNFSGLNRLYGRDRYRGKPFAITEWGAWGEDASGFVNQVFDWVRDHQRTRMLLYYQGWDSTFSIDNKPRTRAVLRDRLTAKRYPAYTPEFADSHTGGVPAG